MKSANTQDEKNKQEVQYQKKNCSTRMLIVHYNEQCGQYNSWKLHGYVYGTKTWMTGTDNWASKHCWCNDSTCAFTISLLEEILGAGGFSREVASQINHGKWLICHFWIKKYWLKLVVGHTKLVLPSISPCKLSGTSTVGFRQMDGSKKKTSTLK
jgi:hypothetical protein